MYPLYSVVAHRMVRLCLINIPPILLRPVLLQRIMQDIHTCVRGGLVVRGYPVIVAKIYRVE